MISDDKKLIRLLTATLWKRFEEKIVSQKEGCLDMKPLFPCLAESMKSQHPSLGDLLMVMEGAALKLRPGATSATLDDLHHDMVQECVHPDLNTQVPLF